MFLLALNDATASERAGRPETVACLSEASYLSSQT